MSESKKPVYYLCQAYTTDPDAFTKACDWVLELQSQGYLVFSPITHSHPIEERRQEKVKPFCKKCKTEISTKGCREGYAMCHCDEYRVFKNIQPIEFHTNGMLDKVFTQVEWRLDYPQMPDYVAWDLAICATMLTGNVIGDWNPYCLQCKTYQWKMSYDEIVCIKCHEKMGKKIKYEPNLIFLFAPNCFGPSILSETEPEKYYAYNGGGGNEYWWKSKGAKEEYTWAKAHQVKCLLLEEFVKGNEVEI